MMEHLILERDTHAAAELRGKIQQLRWIVELPDRYLDSNEDG